MNLLIVGYDGQLYLRAEGQLMSPGLKWDLKQSTDFTEICMDLPIEVSDIQQLKRDLETLETYLIEERR